jgi:tRNA pseudouridine38-40 synthase
MDAPPNPDPAIAPAHTAIPAPASTVTTAAPAPAPAPASPTYKVRLLIKYDGTDFEGWQRQAGEKPTIQAALESAASRLLQEPIVVVGSGRTDSGVHALGQVAHFITTKDPSRFHVAKGLNSMLPASVSVQKAWIAPWDFHAQRSAAHKTYKYRVQNTPWPDPLQRRYSTWLRRPIDLGPLNEMAALIKGTHDFRSFQTGGSEVRSTERTIFEAFWTRSPSDLLEFTVSGSGFLKQMVRNLVGTMLYLEQFKHPPTEILSILEARDRTRAKGTAPAEGLFLESVHYPPILDKQCLDL